MLHAAYRTVQRHVSLCISLSKRIICRCQKDSATHVWCGAAVPGGHQPLALVARLVVPCLHTQLHTCRCTHACSVDCVQLHHAFMHALSACGANAGDLGYGDPGWRDWLARESTFALLAPWVVYHCLTLVWSEAACCSVVGCARLRPPLRVMQPIAQGWGEGAIPRQCNAAANAISTLLRW